MVLLLNGSLLAAGRYTGGDSLTTAEVYTPTSGAGRWTTTGSLASGRSNFQMVLLPNGTALAAGGFSGRGSIATTEVYRWAGKECHFS